MPDALDEHAKADLIATIIDESERLNRFIANLLDMTRLESGAVVPNAALHDLGEIVGSALERAGKILARHRIEVEIPEGMPMVAVNPVLFEQVLFNLLDNAAKYAPVGTTIRLQAWRDRDAVGLQVLDEGEGIPPGDLEQIFDKFTGQKGRPGSRRYRAWARDLARLRRSHARYHHCGQSHRSNRCRVRRSGCRSRPRPRSWTPPHECCTAQGPGRRR